MKKILPLLIIFFSFYNCRRVQAPSGTTALNVGLTGEISTLDPARSYDTVSASVVYQTYEQLFEYHYLKRPFTLQPLLAKSMPTVENAGKRFIIELKEGVRYHPHRCLKDPQQTVKAEDFITQFKRLAFIPTRSNGWWIFDNKIKGINKFRDEAQSDFSKFKSLSIEGLKTDGDLKLILELTEPYPQLLYILAMSFTSPIPMEAVECLENNLDYDVLGTGPFRLEEWDKGLKLKLARFENYRQNQTYPSDGDRLANEKGFLQDGGKTIPFLGKINYTVIKESQTMWLNFLSSKIDFMVIPKDNFSTVIDSTGNLNKEFQDKKIELQTGPTNTFWWISFNMKDPILGKNLNLRKAIAHAINVEKYIEVFTNKVGQKANSIYPPGIFGYEPNVELPYTYNTKLASDFLKAAGHPNGKGLPEFTYDVRGNSATNRQQAEYIKSELEKIGLKIKIELNTFPAFLEKSRRGDLQIWQDGWALDYPDAENVLQLLITKNHAPGPNATYYSNSEFDRYFDEVKILFDGAQKKEYLEKMETIIHKDLPWVMQFYARNYILYHQKLRNFRHSDMVNNYFKYLRLQ
jgi:oligopeptide transport system substrate-binding protein